MGLVVGHQTDKKELHTCQWKTSMNAMLRCDPLLCEEEGWLAERAGQTTFVAWMEPVEEAPSDQQVWVHDTEGGEVRPTLSSAHTRGHVHILRLVARVPDGDVMPVKGMLCMSSTSALQPCTPQEYCLCIHLLLGMPVPPILQECVSQAIQWRLWVKKEEAHCTVQHEPPQNRTSRTSAPGRTGVMKPTGNHAANTHVTHIDVLRRGDPLPTLSEVMGYLRTGESHAVPAACAGLVSSSSGTLSGSVGGVTDDPDINHLLRDSVCLCSLWASRHCQSR